MAAKCLFALLDSMVPFQKILQAVLQMERGLILHRQAKQIRAKCTQPPVDQKERRFIESLEMQSDERD